jgi:hypothetical protein
MASFFVSFLYKDSYIDAKDFSNPVKYYVTSNTLRSSAYNFRQDAYLYKNVSFDTDAGFILPAVQSESHIQLDSISSSTTGDMNTQIFTNVIVGLTNIKATYNRSYVKVQDVSAQVGGIIKFFMIIIEFMLSFYSYVPYLENVYGTLFDRNDKNASNVPNKPSLSANLSQFNLVNDTRTPANLVVHNKLSLKDLKRQKTKVIATPKTHSFCEILFRCFRVKRSKSYVYLAKISAHYEANFDVAKMLLNMQRTNLLYDYNFNEKEREVLEMFRNVSFFESCQDGNKNADGQNNLASSLIFDKLKIPRSLITANQ